MKNEMISVVNSRFLFSAVFISPLRVDVRIVSSLSLCKLYGNRCL